MHKRHAGWQLARDTLKLWLECNAFSYAGSLAFYTLFSLGRYGIAAYLAYTATATASTYGAAGSVVLILLWVYYSSLILLFGAAFTRVYLEYRGKNVSPRSTAVFVQRHLLE